MHSQCKMRHKCDLGNKNDSVTDKKITEDVIIIITIIILRLYYICVCVCVTTYTQNLRSAVLT